MAENRNNRESTEREPIVRATDDENAGAEADEAAEDDELEEKDEDSDDADQ